jgi:Tol biopolymer transport system component
MTILDKVLLRRDTSKTRFGHSSNTMTNTILAGLILAGCTLIAADTVREQELQQAIDLMESKGDFARAVPMFEDASRSQDRGLAARALLYLGQVQERQGGDKARATYERIVKEFASETEQVSAARQRLLALAGKKAPATLTKRLLCEDCGASGNDISPDGRWMAMTDWDSGDLVVRELSSGTTTRLMVKPGDFKTSKQYAETPVFSKDSRQIAYLWDTGEEPRHFQLRIVANEPGAKTRVVGDSREYFYYQPLEWTKDGKKLLVTVQNLDQTWSIGWVSLADGSVKIIKPVQRRFYRTGSRPRLSPDERFIAYSALAINPSKLPPEANYPTDTHVYVVSSDGSTEKEVVRGSGINDGPVWAPDGGRLLFISNRRGFTFDLWSMPVRNGEAAGEAQLVIEEVGRMYAITTAQSSYFFQNTRKLGQDVSIARFKPDGKVAPPRRLTENFSGANSGPDWSADGKYISFKTRRPGTQELWDLVIHSVETGEDKRYYTGSPIWGRSQWFHDSVSLQVQRDISDLNAGPGLRRLDRLTGSITLFPKGIAGGLNTITSDDRFMYIGIDGGPGQFFTTQIQRVDLRSMETMIVYNVKDGWRIGGTAISPDGSTLAVIAGEGINYHLLLMKPDGSEQRDVYKFKLYFVGWGQTLTWSHDGRWLYFGAGENARVQIVRLASTGGTAEPIGVELGTGLHYIALSPDDSQIVYDTSEISVTQIWALDNVFGALK